MIKSVLVLGAGSAGLIAAIGLKRKLPQLSVTVVRSPDIGVIGVGESTTPNLPNHMFKFLGIKLRHFFTIAEPTWKLGVHFLWGPRPFFNYGFSRQLDAQVPGLPRANGYYCEEDFTCVDRVNALMEFGKIYEREATGAPKIDQMFAFHLENRKFVAALERVAREVGVEIIDAKVSGATKGEPGIVGVHLEDGRTLTADFYVDASGFRSELLGRTLGEPFVSYSKSLFNDRAVVGSWDRTTEPILPYTKAETMDCGWCWQIDHEKTINRGYVYCSQFMSEEEARGEFVRKNPKVKPWDHVVKFKSGRYERGWVGNTLAIGNACGFVEPLESSALMMVCWLSEMLIASLEQTQLKPTESVKKIYNEAFRTTWDEVRDFLTLHFHGNTRLDTDYWKHCRADADVSAFRDLLECYQENGPTGLCRHWLKGAGNFFGVEGFLVLLLGMKYPHRAQYVASAEERRIWEQYRAQVRMQAQGAMTIEETLAALRSPQWRWRDD